MPDKITRLHDRAVEGLIRKVRGYVHREVKTSYDIDAQGDKRPKGEVITRKRQEPDLQAIIFTLTNLDSERWRAKPEPANPDAVAEQLPDLSTMNEEALRLLAENFPKQ